MPVQPVLEVLISEDRIHERTLQLVQEVSAELEPDEVPVLVGVLKGSLHFLSDFSRALNRESEIDFMQVSSYRGQKSSSGVVQIKKDLDTNIEDRSVYIIEDIVDTGATLSHLRELLSTRKPKSLKIVSLLSKLEARHVAVEVEHVGFEIPNEFVVGYGLDYGERYRNLPFIAILREQG